MDIGRRALLQALPALVAAPTAVAAEVGFDAYLQPYVETANFAGVVRIERSGQLVFERAYGAADPRSGTKNTRATCFHIASCSMAYTAAAVLKLADRRVLMLDEPAGPIVGGLPGWEPVTVRHLLMQRSGLPDINARDDYNRILDAHQTPRSLVGYVATQPLLFAPGSKQLHEEHSAYNLLALILEAKTGKPFAKAMTELVFAPLSLGGGVDDDSAPTSAMATGNQPKGVYGLEPAPALHWSAKAGNASAYVTAADEACFTRAVLDGGFLSPAMRSLVLDTTDRVGFGWFRCNSTRFGGRAYYMNGRAPGFSSFVLHLPDEALTVVALSNIYSSASTNIGYDVADLARGKIVAPFKPVPLPASVQEVRGAAFRFGPDFYQPNIALKVVPADGGLGLEWGPGGSVTPLIPTGPDRFVDRAYWQDVVLKRDAAGKPDRLDYDRFEGHLVSDA